ncbi:hypothetical protein Peur_007480 [Populus x canadensis]
MEYPCIKNYDFSYEKFLNIMFIYNKIFSLMVVKSMFFLEKETISSIKSHVSNIFIPNDFS